MEELGFRAGLGAGEVEDVVLLAVRLVGEAREVAPPARAIAGALVIIDEAG